MSVPFTRALAEFCTAQGVPVSWEPGWESRGNGQTSAYQGIDVHHTGGQSLNTRTNDLVNGRVSPALAGPLCNSAGFDNGGLHIIAAHPANHAGASGGWDTAPLPVTGLFNRLVWGHEVMYPGTRPMSDAQWWTASVLGAGVCRLTGHDYDPRWVKFHEGTSITGKWDAGHAPGRTYSIADLRASVLTVMKGQHTMATQADADLIVDTLLNRLIGLRDEADRLIPKAQGGEQPLAVILARLGGSLPARIVNYQFPNQGRRNPDGTPNTKAATSLALSAGYDDNRTDAVIREVRGVGGVSAAEVAQQLVDPLAEAIVARLGGRTGITKDDVREVLGELVLTVPAGGK